MENRYKPLLEEKKDLFTRVRTSMGVSEELGLASCSWDHHYPTNGVLVPYNKTENGEYFEVPGRGEVAFSEGFPLIVRPSGEKSRLHVVSIFHQNPFYDGTPDRFLEGLTDERFAGLIAHECAEFLHETDPHKVEDYGVEHELRMDAMAKQFGHGDELISYFQLKIDYLTRDHGREGSYGLMERGILNNQPELKELDQRVAALR